MKRLPSQFHRLYPPSHPEQTGTVQTLVVALGCPPNWSQLAPLWRGVQADWAWPAPAIALNGHDAFELWFALAEPVPLAQAKAVLHGLCGQYLCEASRQRVRCWPHGSDNGAPEPTNQRLPAVHPVTGRWSAFVAPDLAAVFGDDPSLDLPPGDDAQADVLSRLQPIKLADWQRAIAGAAPAALPVSQPATPPTTHDDPRRFLLSVMNDATVDMALRVEAAKALLK